MSPSVLDWLVEGDPAIRWQTERDLLGDPSWKATRSRVAHEGWGRRLLDEQDPEGTWGGGLYQPKWTSTVYTLLLLRRMGLDASNERAITGSRRLLDDADWVDGGVSYWRHRPEAERCVNGMVLSVVASFDVADPRVDSIADLLTRTRMEDGGWNCQDQRGATHSSFHTTISVLEGLLSWKQRTGRSDADDALASGGEVLLSHRMFRSHRTGHVIDERWLTPHFPPRWHYDVLRGLDHLRDAEGRPDPRASEAIDRLAALRRSDGRWSKGPQYSGLTFFPLEPGRVPGRWTTLRALRVLRWWNA
ncbi:MAG TPA: hypothetical protein VLD62_11875 [Acidimicrobiia bacterium]|nr:hypothetical protein [Acidimicrobiia bacterium]